jgi:hypothetical protein
MECTPGPAVWMKRRFIECQDRGGARLRAIEDSFPLRPRLGAKYRRQAVGQFGQRRRREGTGSDPAELHHLDTAQRLHQSP